jgi:hypothetical protein
MNSSIYFLIQLIVLMIVLFISMYIIHAFTSLTGYFDLSIFSICMFGGMSVVLYFLLRRSLSLPNKQTFISLTLANMLFRMAGSVFLLWLYKKFYEPVDNKFIYVFLLIYIIFTIFETYFMIRLSDQKLKKNVI